MLPPAQGGLASGINNTARQLGLAVGIAVLGAVLQRSIADQVEQRTDALGSVRRAVTDRIADGDVAAATQLAPAAARDSLRSTYEAAFASGLNELLLISRRARAHRARGGAGAGARRATSGSRGYDARLRCIVAAVRQPPARRPRSRWACSRARRRRQDRYSLAGGCYALKSVATGKFVAKAADGSYRASAGGADGAEPFRMQATDARALPALRREARLHGRRQADPAARWRRRPSRCRCPACRARPRTQPGDRVQSAAAPSETADWRVNSAGGAFAVDLPAAGGQVLTVAGDGTVILRDRAAAGARGRWAFVAARRLRRPTRRSRST